MMIVTIVKAASLCTFASDTSGKLDVLGHDGDTLGVDGTQVGILKQSDEVRLTGLLQHKTFKGFSHASCLDIKSGTIHSTMVEGRYHSRQVHLLVR